MSADQPLPEVGYRPKPPLWEPARKPPSSRWVQVSIWFVVAAALLVIPGALLEPYFFRSEPVPIEVVVLRAHGGPARDELPAQFQYTARLPEGGEGVLTSERVRQPGDRVVVLRSRSFLTRRVFLNEPERVLSPGQ